MALTRKSLKAMEIDDGKIETIIDMHTETVNALKDQVAEYKVKAEGYATLEAELEKLKNSKQGDDEYKAKYEKEHADFEQFKASVETEKTKNAKEKAYRSLLKEAGVSEKRIDSIIKVTDINAVELENDAIKDKENITEKIKTEWADFIETTGQQGADVNHYQSGNNENTDLGKLSMAEYIKAREKKGN